MQGHVSDKCVYYCCTSVCVYHSNHGTPTLLLSLSLTWTLRYVNYFCQLLLSPTYVFLGCLTSRGNLQPVGISWKRITMIKRARRKQSDWEVCVFVTAGRFPRILGVTAETTARALLPHLGSFSSPILLTY